MPWSPGQQRPRSGGRNAGLVVAAAAVLLLAVVGAGVGGSWQLEERSFDLLAPLDPGALPTPPPRVPPPEATPPPQVSTIDLSWLGVLSMVLYALFVALALWWLGRWLRRWWVDRRPLAAYDAQPGPAEAFEPELPVLRRGVEQAQRHLAATAGGTDAVIAAWLALEDAAASSGVPRGPAQTPTEFTVAVLEATDADADATRELLALYHRARFSGQPIGAADVDAAASCLARLADGWDAVSPTRGRAG